MADDNKIVGDGTWAEDNKNAWVDGTDAGAPKDSPPAQESPAARTAAPDPQASGKPKQNYATIFLVSLVVSVVLTLIVMAVSYQKADNKNTFHNTWDSWKKGEFKPSHGPPVKE
ncbi:MAG: hypothetical protein HQL53_12780 [Magnetococcales bacterium]|nr:hypothetical protein [Magnetococcales bacterium]